MSGYTRLIAGALFPLHERLKHHDSVARRRELERTQWLEPAQLEALRVERLRRFLVGAGRDVAYYRELFAKLNFDAAGVQSLADLRALPLLTKADIRAHGERLKSRCAARLIRYNTGGSSGEPLVFHMGMDRVSHDVAAKWRATRWWGVDIGDPEIVIWGSPIEVGAQDRMRQWRDRLLRSELLPAFEMSQANLDGFVAAIRQRRPAMLFGYPSALAHIAQHAQQRGIALDDVGIRVAFVTSERLYEHQRQLIGQVFGCPVANGYGGRDAGFIAHECPQGGMHISAEDIVVELLDRNGQPVAEGEAGEIVVTHSATGDFPFIRYRTGDVAVASTQRCACGRGLPMLQEIQGRSTDFVVAADGSLMHGLALIYILRDMPELQSFKIVQQSRALTTVYLVPGAGLDRGRAQASIVQGFRRRLGADVDVALEWVEQIPPEKSGKFRYVVSHAAGLTTQSEAQHA